MYTDSDIQVSSKEHAYSEVDEEEMEWNSRGNGINLHNAINFSFLLLSFEESSSISSLAAAHQH